MKICARILLSLCCLVSLSAGLVTFSHGQDLPNPAISKIDNAPMVLVPAGEFIYGMDQAELDTVLKKLGTYKSELFQTTFSKQTKNLPAYYIDKYEVTNEQYAKFIKATNHRKPHYSSDSRYNHPKQPVTGVGIDDAKAYAKWAGKRLPSEEEWEKAARGPNGLLWPWGNTPSGKKYNGKQQANWLPVQVGSFPAGDSPYKASDMAGNVWELTSAIWYDSSPAMRGGSFLNAGAYTLTVTRWAPGPPAQADGANWLGFRCVMDITPETLKNLR